MNFFDNKLIINIKHLAVLYNMHDIQESIIDSLPFNEVADKELSKQYAKLGDIQTDICNTWCEVLEQVGFHE